MNLQDLKTAAKNLDYAVFANALSGASLAKITNEHLYIEQDGMAKIFLLDAIQAFLVVVDADNQTWMEVCEHLDEAQKVATDTLYDKLMLLSE